MSVTPYSKVVTTTHIQHTHMTAFEHAILHSSGINILQVLTNLLEIQLEQFFKMGKLFQKHILKAKLNKT